MKLLSEWAKYLKQHKFTADTKISSISESPQNIECRLFSEQLRYEHECDMSKILVESIIRSADISEYVQGQQVKLVELLGFCLEYLKRIDRSGTFAAPVSICFSSVLFI